MTKHEKELRDYFDEKMVNHRYVSLMNNDSGCISEYDRYSVDISTGFWFHNELSRSVMDAGELSIPKSAWDEIDDIMRRWALSTTITQANGFHSELRDALIKHKSLLQGCNDVEDI